MTHVRHRRLRAPLLTAGCGLALAAAALVAAGWQAALPVFATALAAAAVYYVVGGTDTDVGALIGARPDERQFSLRQRVRALAGAAVLAFGTIAAVVAAAVGAIAWPYAAVVALGVVCFLGALPYFAGRARLEDGGFVHPGASRLDERQSAAVLRALGLAGIVMFVVSAVGGAALSGHPEALPLRILALAFAAAAILAYALYRPRG